MNNFFARVFLLLVIGFAPVFCFAATNQSDNEATTQSGMVNTGFNQQILDKQHQRIELLSKKIASLANLIVEQKQTMQQMEAQLTASSQEIQQLSMQNLQLQNMVVKQHNRLANLKQVVTNNSQLSHYKASTLPNFGDMLLSSSKRLMTCSTGGCHWRSTIKLVPEDLGNELVSFKKELYYSHWPAMIFVIVILAIILIVLLVIYSYGRFSSNKPSFTAKKYQKHLSEDEIKSISGEDIYASKLDLARAYIDMEDFVSAKKILNDVVEKGSAKQQAEAKVLLDEISLAK